MLPNDIKALAVSRMFRYTAFPMSSSARREVDFHSDQEVHFSNSQSRILQSYFMSHGNLSEIAVVASERFLKSGHLLINSFLFTYTALGFNNKADLQLFKRLERNDKHIIKE